MTEHPELLNAARDTDVVSACVAEGNGIEHDFRPVTDPNAYGPGRPHTYLRCVWCHGVACGNYGDNDPCIEIWHHEPKPHRTRSGATEPIGGHP
jgi:hypothetical protein